MNALYNEIEPFAADWLERLIERGHIAPGRVERRSITDLRAADVVGPGQRHFFAGIGGWSYALRLAGVRDDADIWTGSCPCQPFSAAGARRGTSDPRHLWPTWSALIEQCRPPVIFGEQVAGPDGLGWLDAVYFDLERCGYAVGSAIVSAAGVGAPHRRERIYFLAYAGERGCEVLRAARVHDRGEPGSDAPRCGATGALADTGARERRPQHDAARPEGRRDARADGIVGDTARTQLAREAERRGVSATEGFARGERPQHASAADRGMGDAGRDGDFEHARQLRRDESEHEVGPAVGDNASVFAGAVRGFWADAEWVPCRDPVNGGIVYRPVEPGTFPLAHGVPARVGRLRGYGNAIVTEAAAAFIEAGIDAAIAATQD